MKEFWNERYAKEEFAYGESPNEFIKSQIDLIKGKKVLFPAEGEGRNAVFAAKNNCDVFAFDISEKAKKKAEILAQKNKVKINYQVSSFENLNFENETFDAIVLVFAHFPPSVKCVYFKMLDNFLKPGGMIIMEAFSKNHINYNAVNEKAGGPKDIDFLYSVEEIKSDFKNYNFKLLEEKVTDLNEGLFHVGKSSVIRMIAVKK